MTDWIKHDGKGMPVDAETIVMFEVRSGHKSFLGQRAGLLAWRHGDFGHEGSDIVKYRIVENLSAPETAAHSG